MATRELNILIQAKNMASRTLGQVRGDVNKLSSTAGRAASNMSRNLAIGGAAAAGFAAIQVKAGLESLAELERVTAQTNAALKSTGSIAAGSVDDIRARSEALEDMTTIDDKVIQNAQNLLLTFPEVGRKAFEPTLEAALDLNAAMGGDENSLQGVLLQVAKAVNDPIRGMTALRRSGVSFTQQQQDQVKAMTEAGDAAGAQAIVLEELNKQFGGSAAAQADTYAGKMRRVGDAIEGAQMALATAFLPVLEKVADKLQTFLADEGTLRQIEDFGAVLAEGLDDAIDIAGKLPWDAIGTTFGLMGQGAKTVLQMFTSLPPWLQTAIITGWGLNKLTGGFAGQLFTSLAGGLIKGVLGMNAGVVNINAATVNGPGGGVPGGGGRGGGGLLGRLGGAAAVAGGVGLAATAGVMTVDFVSTQSRRLDGIQDRLDEQPRETAQELDESIQRVRTAMDTANKDIVSSIISTKTGLNQRLEAELRELVTARQQEGVRAAQAMQRQSMTTDAVHRLNASEGSRFTQSEASKKFKADQQIRAQYDALAAARDQSAKLTTIANKSFTPNVNVSVSNFLSINEWQRTVISSIRANSPTGFI